MYGEPTMKSVTVKEIYDAIKQNGYDHIRGQWLVYDWDRKSIAGCVLGQAAINLNLIDISDKQIFNYDLQFDEVSEALNRFVVPSDSEWYVFADADRCGNAITFWNDKREEDVTGQAVYHHSQPVYALKTYDDVAAMAYDILSPYFDETVKVPIYRWEVEEEFEEF